MGRSAGLENSAHLGPIEGRGCGRGASRGIMVLLEKHVHLQKEVGATLVS